MLVCVLSRHPVKHTNLEMDTDSHEIREVQDIEDERRHETRDEMEGKRGER